MANEVGTYAGFAASVNKEPRRKSITNEKENYAIFMSSLLFVNP